MAGLPSAGDLYSGAMQQIQGWGNAEQQELQQSYRAALGMGMQSLASAGLAGTTIAPSMRMGYMKQYQMSLNALNSQLTQQRLGAMSSFGLAGIQAEQVQQQITNQKEQQARALEAQELAEGRQWLLGVQRQQLGEKQYYLQAQAQKFDQNAYTQARQDAQSYLQMV